MRNTTAAALCSGTLMLGLALGVAAAAKGNLPGIDAIRGKPAREAAAAALETAEKLAGTGTWERIGVARVYYLSGDKSRGQSIIDAVMSGKTDHNDWQRIGEVYAAAGENDKAESFFQRALAAAPKDDTGQAQIGAWYIRTGRREQGEQLFSQAFARNPDEVWHYVRAAEALLNVPPR